MVLKKQVKTLLLKQVISQQKKAGDKIVQLLSKNKKINTMETLIIALTTNVEPLTDYEINKRVYQLLSGGKMRKLKFI